MSETLQPAPRRVLDFASGYGCTARHIRHVFADSLCATCDIHIDAVNFNKDFLGVESYFSSPVPEQLKLPPQDVIFATRFSLTCRRPPGRAG